MGAVVHFDPGKHPGETVADVAYARIRADILFGSLLPGERLRLDAFGRRYGASVSTMRELLNRLVSEGLIVAEGQRGFEVAPVSPEEFREIGALRLLLEGHAMAQSFAAGDLDWEAGVVAAHHKLSVLESRMLREVDADPVQWKQCDRAFHQALVSACGSRALMNVHAATYDKYLRYQMIAIVFRGAAAAEEHGQLLECALKRNAGRASAILERHIDSCIDHVLNVNPPAWATQSARAERTGQPGKPGRSMQTRSGGATPQPTRERRRRGG